MDDANVPQVREKLLDRSAIFGTIDSWLIWKLTGGKTHAISYSNASVSGALDLKSCTWYKEFLDYLGIPVACFPSIMDDSGNFGSHSFRDFRGRNPHYECYC